MGGAPWRGPTALLLGCERSGLSNKALSCCDHVVHIPQFGSRVASLNVAAAAAVAMSWYAAWAFSTYEEGLGVVQAERVEGLDGGQGRFTVADDGGSGQDDEMAAEERLQKQQSEAALRAARQARREAPAEDETEECENCVFGGSK